MGIQNYLMQYSQDVDIVSRYCSTQCLIIASTVRVAYTGIIATIATTIHTGSYSGHHRYAAASSSI